MTEKEKYVLEHYEISKDGKIYSPYTSKYLKFREDKDGYYTVALIYNSNGDRQPFRVHRLVALKYIPEIEGCNVVNHKDLNKKNNIVENLEWCNVSYNTQHGFDNCAYLNIKRVKVTDTNGNSIIFPNMSDASRFYGYKNPTTLQHWLTKSSPYIPNRGKLKGYTIEFTNESVTTTERITDTVVSE